MAKKELKGNFQLRFAEGLLRVWSTLWLITELSNDKEPVVHRNLFFLPYPCSSFEKKMILLGFLYSYYVSSYHNWHKKTKFILKLLGNPRIDAFFFAISACTGKPFVVMGGPQQL